MSSDGPAISVVVATRNRAVRLAALLESLRGQTLDGSEFEVVVVDDGSTDGTTALLEAEAARDGLNLRGLRRRGRSGPAAARNHGWREGTGALVAFTDDDCVVAPGWLESGLRASREHSDAFVQGRTDPIPEELPQLGPFARTLEIHALGPHYETCNVFYPRSLLERLEGFDESFPDPGGEDADLGWRAIEGGAGAVFADDVRVFHAVNQLGPLGKLKVAARWTGAMQAYRRHAGLREGLTHRVFWKGSHYLLVRGMVGLALRRRAPIIAAWLWRPYLLHLVDRGRLEGGGPLLGPYYLVHDLVELFAVLRGAIRYRVPIL